MGTPAVIEGVSYSDASVSRPCIVDRKLFPHLFLIPAAIIITVLAFLHKNKNKNGFCAGRLGLVVPVDLFGLDHNRYAIATAFGAAAGYIISIILKGLAYQKTGSKWLDALRNIGIAIEYAFVHYPMFACLTTDYKMMGAAMGLLYTLAWFVVDCLVTFEGCEVSLSANSYNSVQAVSYLPVLFCTLLLAVKYMIVLGQEVIKRRQTPSQSLDLERGDPERKPIVLVKPWLNSYVKGIFRSRLRQEEIGLKRLLHKFYCPHPGFRFSTQTVSTVLVCSIFIYQLTVVGIWIGSIGSMQYKKLWQIIGKSLIVSSCFCALLCSIMLVRFMESHKNRMLSMFKGDKSFLPHDITRSQFMVGKSMKYPGYHIAYLVWGYFVLLSAIYIIVVVVILLHYLDRIGFVIKGIVLSILPYLVFAAIFWIILAVSSMIIFRDRSFPLKAIAIKNRNLYLVFSYFFFFIGLIVGFFSAMRRLLQSGLVGLVLIQRVDKSVMPDGFQRFDKGFAAYVGYLHVQAAHRNPVLRVFCQTVCDAADSTHLGSSNVRYSRKARNKWFLLRTLIWNPQIRTQRKQLLQHPLVGNVYYHGASVQELGEKAIAGVV